LEKSALDRELCGFYASLRKEDGDEMTSASLNNIRYGLSRHIRAVMNLDILKDHTFNKSNETFSGKLAKLKRIGHGATKHFDIISPDNLMKIAEMTTDTPNHLQMKTWFTLQYHFAQRGAENIHSMKKSDLRIFLNSRGKKEIHLRDFETKNHRGSDNTKSTQAVIVEIGSSYCPVVMITKYLDHLVAENQYLWQKPNTTNYNTTGKWYHNAKVGENTISTMMKKICQACCITTPYTNHCVRATAITTLGVEFGDNDIRAISGHKSLNALGIYKRTSASTLEAMSDHLHNSLHASTISHDNLPSSSQPPTLEIEESGNVHGEISTQQQPISDWEIPNLVAESEDFQYSSDEWDNLMNACNNAEKNIPASQTIQKKAVQKGNKVIILNNCKGVFNF
jgi:hypothetical protein